MTPVKLVVGVLIRSAALVVVISVYVALLNRSDSTDALSAGLLAFLILVTIALVWALVDGIRTGLVPALVGWALTSVVAGVGIPVVLAINNDVDVAGEVADGALFFAILLFAPAFVGLAVGGIVHRVRDRDEVSTAG